MQYKIRVAVTMGDPAGVGGEIIAGGLESVGNLAEFVVIGDKGVFEKCRKSPLDLVRLRSPQVARDQDDRKG